MSLSRPVKVGNVTNLSEARYCAGMGVDYLSFPVSSIDPKTFKEITGWVSGPKFGIETDSNSDEVISAYNSDFIVKSIHSLNSDVKSNNLVIQLEPNDLAAHWEKVITHKDQILFLEISSSDIHALQKALHEVQEDFKVFVKIKGGLEEYVNLQVDGLSLDGNPEVRPGLKEYPIAEILEKLELAD